MNATAGTRSVCKSHASDPPHVIAFVRRTDAMGLLAKMFGAVPREEMGGIRLDVAHPFWEVTGKTDFPSVLMALPGLLPEESVLYFEGGAPTGVLLDFLQERAIPARAHVAYGTIWPRPTVFHLPATLGVMEPLAELMKTRAYPELAIHFHVYRDRSVLLEWHDAFTEPMLLSGKLPEQKVKAFAEWLGVSYHTGRAEPGAAPNGGPAKKDDNPENSGGPPSAS